MLSSLFLKYSSRFISKWIVWFLDLTIVLTSSIFTFLLKYNFEFGKLDFNLLFTFSLPFIFIYGLAYFIFKTFKGVLRHSGIEDVLIILKSNVFGLFISLLLYYLNWRFQIYQIYLVKVTLSVIFVHFTLINFILIGWRYFVKSFFNYLKEQSTIKRNVILFGAGIHGVKTLEGIKQNFGTGYYPIAIIDDNRAKTGKTINGVQVLHSSELTGLFIKKTNAQELFLCAPSISSTRKKELIEFAIEHNLHTRVIPPMDKWINGELTSKQLKAVQLEDLLQRDTIELNTSSNKEYYQGKTIIVTGAAGSIGSEISRQLIKVDNSNLILVDIAESPIFELKGELLEEGTLSNNIIYEIADIRDEPRMHAIFKKYAPNVVIHAAAYKHVPLMEENVYEALGVNVFGTKLIAKLSSDYQVDKFIMVSTDKAVNPTNIMGTTKRIAELLTLTFKQVPGNQTKFITTRFGNVLGSNGSVIPLFKKQIASGGPITVTHPDITRFFMTIPEACQLVLEAGSFGQGGEIFVFDMGKPIKIIDLAKQIIELSGLELNKDIEIKFTGLRDGEKLFEEVLASNENTLPTHHPKILIAKISENDPNYIISLLESLHAAKLSMDEFEMVKIMKLLVPEFKSQNSKFQILD